MTTDSRAIKGGELFFALKGENFDGNEYALKALEAGAAYAVVNADSDAARSDDSRLIRVDDTLKTLQELARWHRSMTFVDGKPLTVIALTGTNGKTSSTLLLKHVLEKTRNAKVGLIGTMENLIGDVAVPTERTTPESFELQALFARMRDAGCTHVVMECKRNTVFFFCNLSKTVHTKDIGKQS